MVYSDISISEEHFSEYEDYFKGLLEKTKSLILSKGDLNKNISSDDFEREVFEAMKKAAENTPFESTIDRTGKHGFPDIIAKKYFGAEIKMTSKDKWITLGNSVQESTRGKDVSRVYIFFGKFGGKPDVKFRRYEDCMVDIAVTHSPRYKIDMNLPDGESIFHKMQVSYDEFREKNEPVREFKRYYTQTLKKGAELWWIDRQEDAFTTSPILIPYAELPAEKQEKFKAEAYSLFPEILSNDREKKFKRAAPYLITRYNSFSHNFRDILTSGGKVNLSIKGVSYYSAPRIFENLRKSAKNIKKYFEEEAKTEELKDYWGLKKIEGENLEQWKELIDKMAADLPKGLKASDIFESGLN